MVSLVYYNMYYMQGCKPVLNRTGMDPAIFTSVEPYQEPNRFYLKMGEPNRKSIKKRARFGSK